MGFYSHRRLPPGRKTVAKSFHLNNLRSPFPDGLVFPFRVSTLARMTFEIISVLAQATPAAQPRPDPLGGTNMMVWMVFAFVLIYFMTIRPQSKRQKQLQAQIASLKTGDKVVTSGGIHGLVANIQDGPTLTLKIADNVKIEVEKSAVSTILKPVEAKAG